MCLVTVMLGKGPFQWEALEPKGFGGLQKRRIPCKRM